MEDWRITRLVLNNVGVFEHLDLAFKKKKLKERKKKIDEIEVVVEKDRLQLVEWLKQLKK